MLLSKTTGYGIRALAYLARRTDDGPCSLQELADCEEIPRLFLQKILGELRRHRILRSVKGIHGGYELDRPAEKITLWDVFCLLEPDPHLDVCALGRGVCRPESACGLHHEWKLIRATLVEMLRRVTIAQIARDGAYGVLSHRVLRQPEPSLFFDEAVEPNPSHIQPSRFDEDT